MNGKQLKNSILQWAIQGKLVQQDPNDEPASVLLEHIREEKAKLVKEKKIKKDKNESIIYRGDDNYVYLKFRKESNAKWMFMTVVLTHNLILSVFVDFNINLVFLFQLFLHYYLGTNFSLKRIER